MISKPQLASLAMFILVAAPAPAAAQPAPNLSQEAPIVITRRLPPTQDLLVRTVFIGDLNLDTADGQKGMEDRVTKAVEDMCTIPAPLPSYKGPMEKPCRDEAWESARWQMRDAMQRAHGQQGQP
ncbi:MAG TPA: UrcA family protein [Sphingomicrobium sp.]|jgi:UrcA family protein